MRKKSYWEMSTEELAAATRQLDEEGIADRARPLTVAERKVWRKARRKKGRPRVGLGFQRISVSIEKGLLRRVTALAKKRRVTRSRLLALVLEQALKQPA